MDSNKKKILVTGGAGYIGSHAAQALLKSGYDVLVLDNLATGFMTSVSCPLVVSDCGDVRVLDKIFTENQIEAVLHFAASSIVEESVFFPGLYFQNNLASGINLLNAMARHNVKKLIFSSTAAVYGEPSKVPIKESDQARPTNPYGESKLSFERLLPWYYNAHEISSVSLRYFNAAGASTDASIGDRREHTTHLIPRIIKVILGRMECLEVYGRDYPTFDGTAVRDYIHVLDLVEAHKLALEKLSSDAGSFTYNVGTGRGHSVMEVITQTMEVTGRMVPIKYGPRRPGDPVELFADADKIRKEMGFEAKHSDLKTIIKTAWDWYCKLYKIEAKNPIILENE